MKNNSLALILVLSIFMSITGHASLINRGNGLIYDDVLDVTWLQNANLSGSKMNWETALYWAENLEFAGYDDWRLPTLTYSAGPAKRKTALKINCGDGRFDMDASGCDFGWSSSSVTHELAYMFSVNLGNQSSVDAQGSFNANGGLQNTDGVNVDGIAVSFSNIQDTSYWYGNQFSDQKSFFFAMHTGGQFVLDKSTELFAWALRDGDIAKPPQIQNVKVDAQLAAPQVLVLFCLGLLFIRQSKTTKG